MTAVELTPAELTLITIGTGLCLLSVAIIIADYVITPIIEWWNK
jgi:hypothetical protein